LIDNIPEAQDLVDQLYRRAWPLFLERATFAISDDVRQFGERLVGRVPAAEGLLDQSPKTLMHGDFRLGNVLFGSRANGTRDGESVCWVIDWEDVMLWNGMFDVAWFLGGCLRVEDGAEEEGLVRRYHRALIQEGVDEYSWSQCYGDYRRAMLSAFVQGVLTATPSESCDEYARDLAHVVGERFVRACQRLRLYELLP
jgi:aminoglycoside phosphotransferase (APT) family kinase protein